MRVLRCRLPSDVMSVVDSQEGVLRAVRLELHPELELDVVGCGRSLVGGAAAVGQVLLVLDQGLNGLSNFSLVNVA